MSNLREWESPGLASIANCPRHVFAKQTNLLAAKCTRLAREMTYWLTRVLISLPEMNHRAKKNPPTSCRERARTEREQYPNLRGRCCRKLAFPVNDSTFGQIVGREFHTDAVARDDADKVLAHPTGDVGQNNVSTFDLDAETSIGEGLSNHTLDFESFFLLFCHTSLYLVNLRGDQRFSNSPMSC